MKNKITLLNGEELSYIQMGKGSKTLIFLHSTFFTSLYFIPLLEKLKSGYNLYAIDLRGYGDSTYFRAINDISDFADDINLFIKAKKIEKPILIGWGLGGVVALDFSSKFTKVLDKLILINSYSHQGNPLFKNNKEGKVLVGEKFESKNEMKEFLMENNLLINSLVNKDYEKFVERINDKYELEDIETSWYEDSFKQKNITDIFWALANFNLSGTHNFYTSGKQGIYRIRIPVLNIVGLNDKVVKTSESMQNYRGLKQQSILIKYENSKHQTVLDSTERLKLDIVNFVEED